MISKLYIFIGRYFSLAISGIWLLIAASHAFLVKDHSMTAFLELQLAMVWALVYAYERSERRLVEKLRADKPENA